MDDLEEHSLGHRKKAHPLTIVTLIGLGLFLHLTTVKAPVLAEGAIGVPDLSNDARDAQLESSSIIARRQSPPHHDIQSSDLFVPFPR